VNASRTTGDAGTTRSSGEARDVRRPRLAAGVAASLLCLALGACTSAPETAAPAGSPSPAASSASGASPSVAADALTVAITETDGDVLPNGQKLDAKVGQQVVLQVTSDRDDEIHAHTGGDGYEPEVKAGVPATGTFTLDSAGSFEVESHHLEKVIVILNAR
jgi:hypothetical protein